MSRRQAAAQFDVGVGTVIAWVPLFRKTGSVARGKMGGHKPKTIGREHRIWLLQRTVEKDLTIRELVAECGLKVD
jgi:putative transposase